MIAAANFIEILSVGLGTAYLPRRPLPDKFLHGAPVLAKYLRVYQILTSCLDWFRRYAGGPTIRSGAADLPRRPLADSFLCRAIVPASAYQFTKFQLPSLVSFGDMKGSQNWELADKFTHGAILPANAYHFQRTKISTS